jgi:glycogen debranching enzyme
MKRIAFLIPDSRALTAEEQQAWKHLSSVQGLSAKKIRLSDVAAQPTLLSSHDVVWWHCDGTYPDNSELTPSVVKNFQSYVTTGGGFLLSLLASQFVVELGLETVRPNILGHARWTEASWAQDYPDIRGFAGFGLHPLFSGCSGGLYTFQPAMGVSYSSCFYDDLLPSSGSVVAVEKLYIRINERRRIITEYKSGRGTILAVGAHFYFSDRKQRFRQHLDLLLSNSLNYLAFARGRSKRTRERSDSYWTFNRQEVSGFNHAARPIRPGRSRLPSISSGLEIHRDTGADKTDQFFDLTGRRLLIMGNERGGIEEIWAHPIRIFKNIRIGFKVGDRAWNWSQHLNPTITVRPESLTRSYVCDGATIQEIIFASLRSPAAILHYKVNSDQPVQIIVKGQTDLRKMWPLSEQATGSLRHAWDAALQSHVICDASGSHAALVGSTAPIVQHLAGQYSEIGVDGDGFVGVPTDEKVVTTALRMSLASGSPGCSIALAGSAKSVGDAVGVFRAAMEKAPELYAEQVRNYRRLFSKSLQLATPDEELNKSYRWSIAGTERLFTDTPDQGSSFLAGLGFSSAGWDGGQKRSGRPGYAWYFGRDCVWTSLALLGCGEFTKVRSVLDFLGRHQDITGKILHELTTSGHVHYDAADATPLYLILFGRYLRASGDIAFVRREFDRIQKALTFCFSTDTDRDHLIENTNVGHGWIEGGKLFPAHTEHYLASCWSQALAETAYIATSLKKKTLAAQCSHEARRVRNMVRTGFQNESTGFYNFAKNQDGSFREEQTILPTVGMQFGCADQAFSQSSLNEYASDNFSTDWGVRIVGKNYPLFEPTGYHYGSIWPLFTGWTSLAEFRMHRPLQGFSHLMSNALLYDQFAAGCVEEVLHGTRFQPAGVCPHQGWSGSMILQPAVEGLLGLSVDALTNTLTMKPYLPPRWKQFEVKSIRVGGQLVRMKVAQRPDETMFSFVVNAPAKKNRALHLELQPFFPLGSHLHGIWINGRKKPCRKRLDQYEKSPVIRATIQSRLDIRVKHSLGISVVPPRLYFVRGGESRGLRIVEERWERSVYVLTLEGKAGEEYLLDLFDPSARVRAIAGGVPIVRENEHLTLSVVFSGAANAGYVRRELRILT